MFHRNISLKTVKNALSFGRRRSASGSEEQNLLGSSCEHTDRDTEDEGDTAEREQRESGASGISDTRSLLSVNNETKRTKKSKK